MGSSLRGKEEELNAGMKMTYALVLKTTVQCVFGEADLDQNYYYFFSPTLGKLVFIGYN